MVASPGISSFLAFSLNSQGPIAVSRFNSQNYFTVNEIVEEQSENRAGEEKEADPVALVR